MGLLFAEGVIARPEDIYAIEQEHRSDGTVLRVEAKTDAHGGRKRSMAGVSGCGLCGAESLADAVRPVASVGRRLRVAPAAIAHAVSSLREWQPLNDNCGALHAAAFARPDGTIVLSREDVGRHNALDKLIGALLTGHMEASEGFVVMSSRCSYELIQKTAAFGAELLVVSAAPTSLAVRQAQEPGMILISSARGDTFTVVCGGARIQSHGE